MKILFVLEYYYPHIGGVETLFQNLAEKLVKNGQQVRVVTSKLKGEKPREYYNGVEIIRLNLPNTGRRYWFTFFAGWPLIRLSSGFEIIHTTTYNAALPAWFIAYVFRKKIIITVHEVWDKLWYQLPGMNKIYAFFHKFFEWLILRLPFSYYVTDSEYTKKSLLKFINKEKIIQRIYLGVDYDFFNPAKYSNSKIRTRYNLNNNFVYLYFGRPGWAKGVEYLIKAVPIIKKNIPNSKLMLILTKDPLNRYKFISKLISKLSLGKDIILLDPVPHQELPDYIGASDCVVIPSLSEGFGFSAAEASAMKKPIVCTEAGSLPEVVSGQVAFCKPSDSLSLAEAVKRQKEGQVIEIPEKNFLWENSTREYEKIYKSLFI